MRVSHSRLAWSTVAAVSLGLRLAGLAAAQDAAPAKRVEAAFRAGSEALAHNDLAAAQADFQTLLRLDPKAEAGYNGLGVVLLRMGKPAESVSPFEKALALKPGDPTAQLNLASAYEQLREPAKELPLLAKVDAAAKAQRRSLPAGVDAMYARALAASGRIPAAIARMKQAIAADRRNATLVDDLGSLEAMQQDWPDAERSFRAALVLQPALASAHLHLGLALLKQQKTGALEELNAAHEQDANNPVIDLELGRALAANGNDEQAIPLLQQAVESMPQSADAAYQLALALQRTSRTPDAIPLFETAIALQPESPEILTNYGLALCQQQKAAQAVAPLEKAVRLAPDNATARQNLAAAYIQLSQFDDAVAQLRAALTTDPNSPQLHYNLGLAFKSQDKTAEAIPELQAAEKLNPSAFEPPYVLGLLELQDGRYAEAARDLNDSLKLQPENGDAWATLGSVYNHLDQLPEAVSALQQAIQQLPHQPDPHLTLAAVLVKQGKSAEAIAERRKAAALMRGNMNRQRAEVACNSGTALLKSGKISDAIVEFQNAIGFDAGFVDAHLGLADALERQGRAAEAQAERQKAQQLQVQPSP